MDWLAAIPIGLLLSGAAWFAYNFPKKTVAAGPWAFFGVLALWACYCAERAGMITGRSEMLQFVPAEMQDAALTSLPLTVSWVPIFLPLIPGLAAVFALLWISTLKAQRDTFSGE